MLDKAAELNLQDIHHLIAFVNTALQGFGKNILQKNP